MKIYKKIATIAPIAALSTSILCSSTMTFAAENAPSKTVSTTKENVSNSPLIRANAESTVNDVLNGTYNTVDDYQKAVQDLVAKMNQNPNAFFSPDPWGQTVAPGSVTIVESTLKDLEYTDNNLRVSAQATEYKDIGNLQLGEYTNGTSEVQEYHTDQKSQSVTESNTYTNSEGVKLGVSSETTVGLDIPFLAKAEETVTVSSEFTYDHTSSNTTTHTSEEIFSAQTVKCRPGYITSFIGNIQNAKYSGTYTGKARGKGQLVAHISYGGVDGVGPNVTFEESKPTILNSTTTFTGVAGKYHNMLVKETPINGGPTKIMTLKAHQKLVNKES